MTDNVFIFPGAQRPADPINPTPNPGLIDMLEKVLVMAKSGRLQSFIGTGFDCENQRLALWCNTHPDVYQMLGSINWLEHEYVHRVTKSPGKGL